MHVVLLTFCALSIQGDEASWKRRVDERRTEARQRLDEHRRELAEEAKAARAAADDRRKRLSGRTVKLAARTGGAPLSATLRDYTITDVEIDVAGKGSTLPWDTFTPESLLAAADLMYDAGSAASLFERGRFLLARRLWKDAKDAFQRAVKLDEDLDTRVAEVSEGLDKLIEGKGDFHASAVARRGPNGLELKYDFTSEEQAEDLAGVLKIDAGRGVLESDGRAGFMLSLDFVDEVEVEARVTSDVPVSVFLLLSSRRGWEIVFGLDGVVLYRRDKAEKSRFERGSEVARGKAAITKSRPHDLAVVVKDRKFRVLIDRKEALAFQSTDAPGTGDVAVQIEKGQATFAPALVLRGQVDGRELDKRFAESEILVRRIVDPDLKDVASSRDRARARAIIGSSDTIAASAEHPFYTHTMLKDLMRYDDAKRKVQRFLADDTDEAGTRKELEALLAAYPKVPSLYYLRALVMWDKEDGPAARADLDRALALCPDFFEALTLLATIQDDENDFDGAMASAGKALALKPDHAPAYVQRAISGYAKDPSKVEAWKDDLRLAKHLQPSNAQAGRSLRALTYQVRGPRDLGCRFEVESAHYVVVTDMSQEAAKAYADRVEGAYRFYVETFKHVYREKPFRKPRIAVFNTRENYLTYYELLNERRRSSAVGVFMHRYNELILFEMVDLEETYDTLYHEAFHHFMSLMITKDAPYWYNEGIAEYMAGIDVKDGRVERRGKVSKLRLPDIQPAVARNEALPFEDIMTQPPGKFYRGDQDLKYAQAWSMLHFFYEADKGRHRPLIEKYFDQVRAGKPIRECFDAVFRDTAKELQKEWAAYVKSLK